LVWSSLSELHRETSGALSRAPELRESSFRSFERAPESSLGALEFWRALSVLRSLERALFRSSIERARELERESSGALRSFGALSQSSIERPRELEKESSGARERELESSLGLELWRAFSVWSSGALSRSSIERARKLERESSIERARELERESSIERAPELSGALELRESCGAVELSRNFLSELQSSRELQSSERALSGVLSELFGAPKEL